LTAKSLYLPQINTFGLLQAPEKASKLSIFHKVTTRRFLKIPKTHFFKEISNPNHPENELLLLFN
jgi:hypothetical protein